MRNLSKPGIMVFSFAAVFTFLIQNNTADAEGCYTALTNTETKWNKIRSHGDVTDQLEKEVSRHLRRAAELRHLGDASGCLEEIENAKELMKFGRQNN